MYLSLTMGNLVDTKFQVIGQVFESLFKWHTLDFRCQKVNYETK